jgi:hypothetical protein
MVGLHSLTSNPRKAAIVKRLNPHFLSTNEFVGLIQQSDYNTTSS